MSSYETIRRPLISAAIRYEYADESQVSITTWLDWTLGPWSGEVVLSRPWSFRNLTWRFTVDHWPFESERLDELRARVAESERYRAEKSWTKKVRKF